MELGVLVDLAQMNHKVQPPELHTLDVLTHNSKPGTWVVEPGTSEV